MGKYTIGVDIGGTKIAAGAISSSGKLKKKVTLPTLADGGIDASLNQVYLSIAKLMKSAGLSRSEIKGIGACAPGPLDPKKGIVHNPPNLPGWAEVHLAKLIREKTRIPTRLENDANAAGIAETIWGAARGYKDVFYVTVSTGIGTAVIIDGKIYHGKNGMAGEGGHVTINYDGGKDAVCGCGHTGCIEALASGPHTVRRLVTKLKKSSRVKTRLRKMAGRLDELTMEDIYNAAVKKDKVAVQTIKEQGKLIGIWLGSMINVLDPEIIVIGGGVSLIGGMLFREIRDYTVEHTINIFADKTPIVQAKLKRDVGIFGAASLFAK